MKPTHLSVLCTFGLLSVAALAISIPGTNEAESLETIGTIAKTFDTIIFTWGAKIGAAVIFLLGGWAIKENRLGMALLCLCAGFIMLFAPKLANEIQSLAGVSSVFGK